MNSTQLADYPQRQHAWQAAIDAAEKHVKIGMGLQSQGGGMLKDGEDERLTAEQALKLLQQGVSIIEKGVKIERDARDKLLVLYEQQPRPTK